MIHFSHRAIWNELTDSEAESVSGISTEKSITVNFTDDIMWEGWGEWVFNRCEVSSNEKLVTVLHKVCNTSVHLMETQWAKIFYKRISQLIKIRIESCTEEDMCKKLRKFDRILDI